MSNKMKDLALFSDEEIDDIHVGEQTVILVAFIERVMKPVKVGKLGKDVFKFVLSNGQNRSIQCCIWNEDIALFQPRIEMNKVVCITGGQALWIDSKFNRGNVGFELCVSSNTSVEVLRDFVRDVKEMSFTPLKDAVFGTLRVEGYVRTKFQLNRIGEDKWQLCGSITDGEYKLEIFVLNEKNIIDIPVGRKIQVVGFLDNNRQVNNPRLEIDDMKCIVQVKSDNMSPAKIIGGKKSIMKREFEGGDEVRNKRIKL